MARDQVDMTPIETREELIAWFEAGSKPKSQPLSPLSQEVIDPVVAQF